MLRRLSLAALLAVGLVAPVSAQVAASGNAVNQGVGAGAATNFWNFRLTDGTTFYNAATDRTTAGGPFSIRLSDGSAFYDTLKTGQLPSALVSGRLDVNLGAWLGSTAPTVGQKAMASSLPVAIASDQSAVSVSGTVTANQGGSPWQVQSNSANIATETTLGTLSQAQASTTSGQKGPLAQGAVTTAAPSYSTGQTDPLSLTTAGSLRTDESSIAGTTTLTGNGTTGAGSQRVTIASDNTPFTVVANQGSNNATPWNENVAQWIGSTAPTVGQKAMSSSVPVAIASDNGIVVAQASTTSGQSGPLVQGAVTTAQPSYTTGQTSPLSVGKNGGLRVSPTWPDGGPPNSIPISDAESIRLKIWNASGCENSLQTCDTYMGTLRLKFVSAADPSAAPITITKTVSNDNDSAASGLASGGASWPFGTAAGRGRGPFTDADSPGTAFNLASCTAGPTGVTVLTTSSSHNIPIGQVLPIQITGAVCTPSLAGTVVMATVTGTTTLAIPAVTTAGTGAVGSFYSSNILSSATATFTAGDVGKTIIIAGGGGVACGSSETPCQGPKFPYNVQDPSGAAVTYQGTIVGFLSSTQVQVKPGFVVDPAGTGRLYIEPVLNGDGTPTAAGKGWLSAADFNFWQNGNKTGQTFVEMEINSNPTVPGNTFNIHMGYSLVCDFQGTSEHLSWPGSRVCRHKADGPGWVRRVLFGTTGGSGNTVAISAVSVANPTILTTANNGWIVGQTVNIFIAGTSVTTSPAGGINGLQTATVVSTTSVSLPLNVTAVTTGTGTISGPFQIPAAGSDFSAPLPLNTRWRIRSVTAVFTASATVINRFPILTIQDSTGNVIGLVPGARFITASEVHRFYWAPGVDTRAIMAPTGSWAQVVALPTPFELFSGWRLVASTTNLQAGDAWTQIVVEAEQLPDEAGGS